MDYQKQFSLPNFFYPNIKSIEALSRKAGNNQSQLFTRGINLNLNQMHWPNFNFKNVRIANENDEYVHLMGYKNNAIGEPLKHLEPFEYLNSKSKSQKYLLPNSGYGNLFTNSQFQHMFNPILHEKVMERINTKNLHVFQNLNSRLKNVYSSSTNLRKQRFSNIKNIKNIKRNSGYFNSSSQKIKENNNYREKSGNNNNDNNYRNKREKFESLGNRDNKVLKIENGFFSFTNPLKTKLSSSYKPLTKYNELYDNLEFLRKGYLDSLPIFTISKLIGSINAIDFSTPNKNMNKREDKIKIQFHYGPVRSKTRLNNHSSDFYNKNTKTHIRKSIASDPIHDTVAFQSGYKATDRPKTVSLLSVPKIQIKT